MFSRLVASVLLVLHNFDPTHGEIRSQCYYNNSAKNIVDCSSWRSLSLVMLENDDSAANSLEQYKKFTRTVIGGCGQENGFRLYAPALFDDLTCRMYHIGDTDQISLIDDLVLPEVYNPFPSDPGTYFVRLLGNASDCSTKMDSMRGEALYFFFDSDCSYLTAYSLPITSLISNIMKNGFYVKILWYNNGETKDACMSETFPLCINGSMCEVKRYRNDDELAREYSNSLLPCKRAVTIKQNDKLFIILGCVFGSIALISIIVLALYCFRLNRQRRIAEEIAALKMKTDYSAFSNHYTNLKKLAKINKYDDWEVPRYELVIMETEILGRGAFGMVNKGILKGRIPLLNFYPTMRLETKTDGACEVAVKRLPPYSDDSNRLDAFHEITFMKTLGFHPHVLCMLGCVSDPVDPIIIVEYCSNGDLLHYLRSHRSDFKDEITEANITSTRLDMKCLLSFAWQICDGLDYMSSKNFIHRDIAARNVLLTGSLVAKIGDFGLCRHTEDAQYTSKGGRLPFKWMAPEAITLYEFTIKTDVWAYAVLLHEIYTLGDTPYHNVQPADMSKYLLDGNRLEQPERCPDEIYSIMKDCWDSNPNKRPIFSEIRSCLAVMLHVNDDYYGYLTMEQRTSSMNSGATHCTIDYENIPVLVKFLDRDLNQTSEDSVERPLENEIAEETESASDDSVSNSSDSSRTKHLESLSGPRKRREQCKKQLLSGWMAGEGLSFVLVLWLVFCANAVFIDLNCTYVIRNMPKYAWNAVNCENRYSDAACESIYPADIEVDSTVARPSQCYSIGGEINDELKRIAILTCPKTCGYCCMTSEYYCRNAAYPRVKCEMVSRRQCEDPVWMPILAEDCPNICGFCTAGGCVDKAVECENDPSICRNQKMQAFVQENLCLVRVALVFAET
ncbi:unnamed protein product [Caenorhabditis auriculariae]|uniref:Protein kinase domain-containing protein n=1 Tax=Caenorhabditis auriculariae TaxID=2777116 RepID=A0A8S1GUC8_9PELO|nr:unnamed protein product [Caenorhabditis auriculariae]